VKSTSEIQSIKSAEDLAGKGDCRFRHESGTYFTRLERRNKRAGREPALPVYLTDDASGNLYIQSGRADVFFGPQSVSAYKAALTGKTRVVGLGPKKAFVATTTKKGNGLVYACRLHWTALFSKVSTRACWRGGVNRAKRWRNPT
jgi:polar amino acid transport system substrate-binding protein